MHIPKISCCLNELLCTPKLFRLHPHVLKPNLSKRSNARWAVIGFLPFCLVFRSMRLPFLVQCILDPREINPDDFAESKVIARCFKSATLSTALIGSLPAVRNQ
mmetsp:Transcript_22325/g.46545  ORF Transcript_22325/g.46545 Transcript_22325/m.46545 type:complete len:104 (-) Transcript_22325:66-377(-)